MRNYVSQLRNNLKKADRQERYSKDNDFFKLYSYAEGLLALANILKLVTDSFTPYKTARHRQRDLLQWFSGIANIMVGLLRGVIGLIGVVGQFFWITLPSLFTGGLHTFFVNIKANCEALVANFIGMITQILLGVVQLVTSPFSIARVLWRSALTWTTPWQLFEQRQSIVNLVSTADVILKQPKPGSVGEMRKIIDNLAHKADSNIDKKQKSFHQIPPRHLTNDDFGSAAKYRILHQNYIDIKHKDGDRLTKSDINKVKNYLYFFRAEELLSSNKGRDCQSSCRK